jgi:cytochrome c5
MLIKTGDMKMFRDIFGYCLSLFRARLLVRYAFVVYFMLFGLGMTEAHSAQRSGESVVREVCSACHKLGKNGAPVIGDKSAWAKRKELGLTSLTEHALEGIRNMPAHGGSAGLSSIDLERAIIYIVNQSGGNWIEPVDKDAPRMPRSGEQLVKEKCGDCHLSGKDGAPIIGDRAAWVGRVSKGLEKVITSGIHGRGAMPARGGIADLSDAEMRAAVIYMFTKSTSPKRQE